MLDRINDVLWWTGALIWIGVGGGIVLSMIASCYLLVSVLSWGYAKRILGDLKGLHDVRQWVAVGRPKVGSGILTTKE